MPKVAIVRYEEPGESVRQAVELSQGLAGLPQGAKVFLKPNIVFWTKAVPFPKWGVITTSRVVEDLVVLLKEAGAAQITIGEGMVMYDPKDTATPAHAFETLGYNELGRRYGVKTVNVFERPFRQVDLGDGVELAFNVDALDSDFLVDLPVMKTHAQARLSLGLKNLKGLIDIPSRKKCHNAEPGRGLDFMVSHLAQALPPMFTLVDGIYTIERGPSFDGKVHRSNLLAASADLLSADFAAARLLGHDPAEVPHLALAAARAGRPTDLSDVEVKGLDPAEVGTYHGWDYEYTPDGSLPLPMVKAGVAGLAFYKYDDTLCTYCSGLNGIMLAAISLAWQGKPFDEVEVLTGKAMAPRGQAHKTILVGKCMYQAHKDNPAIQEMLAIKGCPPKAEQIVTALHQAGIPVNEAMFEHMDQLPGFFMGRYAGRPEFEEAHFQVA
ncbi:MAG: DUF362 domain-containing protein [Deltaproteobacteria bacterium]|nr:DUF362 domain-containing protein [Deltaproteobacteria bacterium]